MDYVCRQCFGVYICARNFRIRKQAIKGWNIPPICKFQAIINYHRNICISKRTRISLLFFILKHETCRGFSLKFPLRLSNSNPMQTGVFDGVIVHEMDGRLVGRLIQNQTEYKGQQETRKFSQITRSARDGCFSRSRKGQTGELVMVGRVCQTITVRGSVPSLDKPTWLPGFLDEFVDLRGHNSVFSRKQHRPTEVTVWWSIVNTNVKGE